MLARPPADLDPLLECWEAGRAIVRCHGARQHERAFNRTSHLARFRPLTHGDAIVPTLYGASDLRGALSETVLHDVPVRGPNRWVLRAEIERWVWSEVTPRRDLSLVALHRAGLRRIQATRKELIESDAAHYADTVPWADALHDVEAAPDGLCWRSRQHDDSLVLMLFGTRVREADLQVVRPAESLDRGAGGELVYAFAEACGITVVS